MNQARLSSERLVGEGVTKHTPDSLVRSIFGREERLGIVERRLQTQRILVEAWSMRVDSIPRCWICDREFVRGHSNYGSICFMEAFDKLILFSLEMRLYQRDPRDGRGLWAWEFGEGMQIEIVEYY